MTALGAGVRYDPASDYEWEQLNETAFLARVFGELRSELGRAFGDYDFHLVSSHDPDVRPRALDEPGERKVLIWISDDRATIPSALAPHFHAIFKSHLPRESPGSRIFAFNLGYVGEPPTDEPKPIEQRTVSVFFSGVLSGDRRPLYRALHPLYRRLPASVFDRALALRRRRFGGPLVPFDLSSAIPGSVLRFTPGFKQGLPATEYKRLLGECRIALCPPGARDAETFRHMEATRAGCVVVTQPLPSTRFYRGAPFLTVPDWPRGIASVHELLTDPAGLAELQAATLRWWDEVCGERATARYMAECLRSLACV